MNQCSLQTYILVNIDPALAIYRRISVTGYLPPVIEFRIGRHLSSLIRRLTFKIFSGFWRSAIGNDHHPRYDILVLMSVDITTSSEILYRRPERATAQENRRAAEQAAEMIEKEKEKKEEKRAWMHRARETRQRERAPKK